MRKNREIARSPDREIGCAVHRVLRLHDLTRLRPALLLALVAIIIALSPAQAVEPGEVLKDPALEARARRLSQELRCVVCQNQSIDDSNAPLAHDLRVLVRERLAAGDTDAQVLAFVEARYGAFVLLRPRLTPQTVLLWTTPLLLLAGAAAYLWRFCQRAAAGRPEMAPLSPEEQRRLDELIRLDQTGSDLSRPMSGSDSSPSTYG